MGYFRTSTRVVWSTMVSLFTRCYGKKLLLNKVSVSPKKHADEVPKPTGSFLDVWMDVGKVHVILESCIIFWSTIICSHPQCNITLVLYLEAISLWHHDHHSIPAFTTETGCWDWNSSRCIIWDAEHQCLSLAIRKANQISWGRIWGQSYSFL